MHYQKAISLFLIWLWGTLWLAPALTPSWAATLPASGQRRATLPSLVLNAASAGVTLDWQLDPAQAQDVVAAATALQQLPSVRYGGYQLPMQLATVLLDETAPTTPQIQQLASLPWTQALTSAVPLTPTVSAAEQQALVPLPDEALALPTAPVFLLREGRLRGQRIGVFAFSPLYQEAGATKLARQLHALLPGATPLDQTLPSTLMTAAVGASTAASRAANGAVTPPPDPTNAAAAGFAVKVRVSQAGIQQMTGAALLAAGLPAGTNLTQLHLARRGTETPLEVQATDGILDDNSTVRFYAQAAPASATVGDRWNLTDTYWLTINPAPGLRMATRAAPAGNAPIRISAFEMGVFEHNQLYESNMAGLDGDHWFAEKMSVDPIQDGVPTSYDTRQFILSHQLPLAPTLAYTSVFTITGSARTIASHSLRVEVAQGGETLNWTNHDYFENWQKTIVSNQHAEQLNMVLLPGLRPSDIRIDKIFWRQPVILSFSNQGATFVGVAGTWLYHLSGMPVDGALYDITDPAHPQRLLTTWGTTVQFMDGPQVHQYLVAGPGTVAVPQLIAHQPTTFPTGGGADEVYLLQAPFREALAPLVAHRQAQGYRVAVVDVQDVYDAWSYGQVSPDAIRNFLRYAVYHWRPSPIAAVLIGDSTTDPNDYTENHNPNIMPAYLANVDPWQGEAPCENCYAQLDDDMPLGGLQDPGFLTDIWLGRFSVQTPNELKDVVNKILRYETQDLTTRHYSSLYVADDYIHPDGSTDAAGDFAYHSDLVVTGDAAQGLAPEQSPQLPAVRVYYDPTANGVSEPWREPDAAKARLRVIDELKKGPGLVSFNGHANHYQWASTVRTLPEPYLFGINDIYLLHNLANLPIVLEMTCYTAQFVQVSPIGVTIDENFQKLPDGGAAAIWGSAGLTVSAGQDSLMRGFQRQLWSLPPLTARLGELVQAGYFELFENQDCCQEVRKVYLLLGDPLTPAFVWAPAQVFLPIVTK